MAQSSAASGQPTAPAVQHLGQLEEYVAGKLADVDAMATLAEERAQAIPRVPELAEDVATLRARVAELLFENAALRDQLDRLARRVDALEARAQAGER